MVTTTIAGPLAPGASTTVSIVLNLEMSSGPNAWNNYAEVSNATDDNGNPVTDADSTPDNNPNNDAGGNQIHRLMIISTEMAQELLAME